MLFRACSTGASAANAVIERIVWEMQSTTRSLVAEAELVHNTTFGLGSAILAWAVEFSGQVGSRFQRSVSDVKTACERWKQKSYRMALAPFGELVMFMGIMLGLGGAKAQASRRIAFMSLGMAPANVKVAELFCRNRFGGTAVDVGFERGLVVDCATGLDIDDEEQMEEVERRVRDEELTRATGKLSEVKDVRDAAEGRTAVLAMSIRGMRGLVASVRQGDDGEVWCVQDEG